jgi:plastocyanin domain-containing protein
MDVSEIFIVATGSALIGLTLWYFFGPREATAALTTAGGVQEINVLVKGGYAPDVIAVRAGVPVRLNFYRDETAACSDTVVFGDFGISRSLPPFQSTSIEFTPPHAGEFTFTCGMNMMRGKLIVEER